MESIPYDKRSGKIWFNGKTVDWAEANIHILNHGLHYASCVFEGERVYEGEIFKLEEHTERLFHSAKRMGISVPYSPSEINELGEIDYMKKYRVGGMVKKNSISMDSNQVIFIITDYKNEINVKFSGAIPNLFSEEKGVVAEGFLKDKNFLEASKILAKHDENYMPPEVSEALKDK